MSISNDMNVAELLNLSTPMTMDQVNALRGALTGPQAGEVRQAYGELKKKIEAGGSSAASYGRAGM